MYVMYVPHRTARPGQGPLAAPLDGARLVARAVGTCHGADFQKGSLHVDDDGSLRHGGCIRAEPLQR
jgi:hypothetical protein